MVTSLKISQALCGISEAGPPSIRITLAAIHPNYNCHHASSLPAIPHPIEFTHDPRRPAPAARRRSQAAEDHIF
jgi:hypothetical protein